MCAVCEAIAPGFTPMTAEENVEILIDRIAEIDCAQCGTRLDVSAMEPFANVECPSCGNQDTVPARFGNFRLLNLISRGGMGAVYRARDESLGRLVAIKVMLQTLGEDEEFVESFKHEAQAAARLNHPNVAQIYSFGQFNGQPYIVMELVSGQRFDRMIENHPTGLDPSLVMRIGIDIAEGLQAADEIGLIHDDIKPENILLDEKRKAKLVDFGIASFANQRAMEGIWGTPYYIAPEKVQRQKSDARSDIYSLGATLYHALAGVPPFEGETPVDVVKARLNEDPPRLDELRKSIPKEVAETIARMLQRDSAQRHPTYKSLIGDMRRNLEHLGGSAPAVAGKRVVLKKKGTASQAATGARLANGRRIVTKRTLSTPAGTGARPPVDPIAIPSAGSKRKGRGVLTSVILLIVVAVLVGGVFFGLYLRQKRAEEIERRRQAYELRQAVNAAGQTMSAAYMAVSNVVKTVVRFDPLVEQVDAAVRDIVGDEAVEESDEAPPPEPEAVSDPAAAAPAPPPGPVVDEAGREAPFGMPSRAEMDRRLQGEPGAPPAATPATSRPAAPRRAPAREATEVEKLAVRVRDARSHAQEKQALAERSLKLVEVLYGGATNATAAAEVSRKHSEMSNLLTVMQAHEADVGALYEETRGLVAKAAEEREALLRTREQEAQAAEARRREQEREARLQAELDRVDALEAEAREHVRKSDFKGALEVVQERAAAFESDAARERVRNLTDRYRRLVQLRQFLVETLNRDPFKWGWIRAGGAREDILGADAEAVKLKNREVPWDAVGGSQLLRIVEHCIASTGTRRSVRGEMAFAAALYCAANDVQDLASRYIERALQTSPYLEEEIERLMPGP